MVDKGEKSRATTHIHFVSEVLVFVATENMFTKFVLFYKSLKGCLIHAP